MARLRAWCASPLFRPTRARRRTSGSVVLDHEQGAFDAADFPQRRCQLVLARVRGVGLRVPGGRLGDDWQEIVLDLLHSMVHMRREKGCPEAQNQ